MGYLWPTSHYMQISVGSFTKGLGFGDLVMQLLELALFPPAFLALAAMLLKKQEQ